VLPLSVLSSHATTQAILAQFHTPNEYDTAGQFARQRLSEQDRAALAIAGSDLAGLARAQFHVDSARAGAITLDAGAPLVASELPARRKWLLVVGQHALPADAQVEARTPQYALLRLGFNHTRTAAVSFSANAASVLERAEGLAASEPWGAWSNAQQVKLRFAKPLPAALNVFVNAHAIGPNIGKDFIIRVGAQTRTFRLGASTQERFFQFATDGSARDVTIEVPQPVTPRELGLGADDRKIGLGLVGMEIGAGL
jgi:phosphoglycerol transferase